MKKRTLTARLISLWLVAALMLVGMPVIAQDNAAAPTTAAEPAVTDVAPAAAETAAASSLLGPGELTLEQLALATLPAGDIPDALPAGKVAEKGHVNRLFEQEEGLSHILFQNRDGGKTAYFYGQPVKYIDADGHTRDKSKTLVPVNKTYGALGYDYGVEQNSIRHYYAKDPAVGILVELGGHTVRIIPQAGASLVLPRGQLNENRMVYNNLFGTNTALVYTPLLSGVKEDIILRSFTGQSDFAFTYRTSGLSLVNIDGTYAFVDESGLPLATLGDILITDAAGHTALGSLTVTETANGIYTVIVHADRAFLTAPTTVYPVTVDPTINEIENGASAILDYAVYNGSYPSDAGSYHYLGYASTGSVGRLIYKLPMFIKNSNVATYTHLNQYQISSAYLAICGYPAAGEPVTFVNARPITQSWTNTANAFTSTSLFNSCTNGTPSNRSPVYFDDTYSEINVTAILRSWAAYNAGDTTAANPANGLVLVDETESNPGYYKKVYTVENAGADMFFTFDYSDAPGGEYYLANVGAGGMLQRSGSAVTVGTYASDATTTWLIEYVGNGYHVIRSSADQTKLLSSGPALNTVSGSSIPTASKWVLSVGVGVGGYIFKNASTNTVLYSANGTSLSLISAPGMTSSSYANTAWYTFEAEETVWPTSVSYTGETFFTTGTVTSLMLTPTPANADYCSPQYFTWTSDQDNFDFSGATLSIEAPGGIATITATHKYTGLSLEFTIKSGVVNEGNYLIRNRDSGKFMDCDANGNVIQDNHDGETTQIWRLELLSTGEYKFYANGGTTQVLVAISTGYLTIDLDSNSAKWCITATSNEYLRITPSHSLTTAIGVEPGANAYADGINLICEAIDSSNEEQEWFLIPFNYADFPELVAQEQSQWCWAAVSKMFALHYDSSVEDISQAAAVQHVKSNVNNQTGNLNDAFNAISYYLRLGTQAEAQLARQTTYVYTEDQLQEIFDAGHVIYVSWGWYEYNSSAYAEINGHAVLLCDYVQVGYVIDDQEGPTHGNYIPEYWYVVRDPWPVNGGKTYLMSYSRLCRGDVTQPGEGYYEITDGKTNVWAESIVKVGLPNPSKPVNWPVG